MGSVSKKIISKVASFFKVVGDETRMGILCEISDGEMCVNDIASGLSMTKSAVSHQLRLLKDDGLVKSRREGRNIFYSLDDQHVVDLINIAMVHVEHKSHDAGCRCRLCAGEALSRQAGEPEGLDDL